MTFLPIVERELRVAARRRATYWLRVLEACLAVAVCAFGIVSIDLFKASAFAGQWIFQVLSWLGLAYVLLLGIITTCDALSRERREGTLGLLFLTDLKGYDVVLGKLAASSLSVSYGLLAMLPVLAIPLMLGGVTLWEFARVALVWMTGLFFSLSIGLAVSSLCRDERNAFGGAFSVLLSTALLLPLVGAVIHMNARQTEIAAVFLVPSPIFACSTAFAKGFHAPLFWTSIITLQLASLCLLGFACRAAHRVSSDPPARSWRSRWRERWRRLGWGSPAQQLAFRRVALAINPLLWLLTRDRRVRAYPWVFLLAIFVIWLWGFFQERSMAGLEATLALGFLMHVIFKVWVANMACYSFAEERAAGALELLFSTPLKTRELLRGPWLAIRHLLGPAVCVAIAAELILLFAAVAKREVRSGPGEGPQLMFMIGANIGFLFLDGWALYWVGTLAGLKLHRPQNAVWLTLGTVLLLPWLCVWGTAALLPDDFLEATDWFIALAWVGFSLLFDLALGLWARTRMRSSLREIALHGLVGRPQRAARDFTS